MTSTIAEKLVAAIGRLTPADCTWLEAQGVPPHAIYEYPGPIGAGDTGVFIQPIMSDGAYSDFIGIVAWQQRDPSRFWVLDDAGDDFIYDCGGFGLFGLGQHLLAYAAYRRGSLAVVANPLEWSRRYGACFCPLVWPDAAWELMHCRRLIAMPSAYGLELRRRLDQARPQIPRIEVEP